MDNINTQYYGGNYKVPTVRYETIPIYSDKLSVSAEVAALIPPSLAKQYQLFPVKREGKNLYIAVDDPDNFIAIEHIKRITGLEIIPSKVSKDIIYHHINQLYGNEPIERALEDFNKEIRISESGNSWTADDSIMSAPIVRLVDSLIEKAADQKASDIHIEPMKELIRIRFRIDGLLHTVTTLPLETHDPITTRVKVLGNMNIAEKRLPQDGRSEIETMGRNIDIRISTIPTIYGEKCVLRLLDRDYFLFPKDALGFSEHNLTQFNRFLKLSHGIVLVTGPTGSGKSTTLYTMLNELNDETDNIITIEDPVECKISGINQIQINTKGGMTFANSLRSVLRQDPDVIMLGEIRDKETAEMAIRAAITGHLVLSTIHTHNAVGAVGRLLDMGVQNYLLADALMGVISQRLVRKVCPYCRQPYRPSNEELQRIGLSPKEGSHWYQKVGCIKCNYTGYKGRTAIHEVLGIDKEIRRLIQIGVASDEIYNYSINSGLRPLKQACIDSFEKGLTTFEEAIRLLHTFE